MATDSDAAVVAASPPIPPTPASPTSNLQTPRSRSNTGSRASRAISRLLDGPAPKYASIEDSAEGSYGSGKTAVKVAVRVRPPVKSTDPGFDLIPHRFRESTCDVPTPTSLVVQASQGSQDKKHFIFDQVFDTNATQDEIWNYVSDSIPSFVQGYNVSVMAYGQSGAGKSYTMGTSGPEEQGDLDLMGIVPRAAQALFEKLSPGPVHRQSALKIPKRYSTQALPSIASFANLPAERNWTLKATYVEIYNEQLRDLLLPENTPQADRATVVIREDTKGRIILAGLTQVEINSVDDLLNALNFGSTIRQTDATAINARSSRSHAVFSLNLIQKKTEATTITPKIDKRRSMPAEAFHNAQAQNEHVVTIDSKLHFVDLAGSERLKNTGATGERQKEGISINAGLTSLGKVISQLSSKHSNTHISYRDSRLTRMLQDSLGGNAITFMVACVNPAAFHMNETLNTLHYAQRARAIQSKPEIQQAHEDGDKQAAIDRLRAEVSFLRDQIRHTEHSGGAVDKLVGRREADLHMQLLDAQESYSALSKRHSKLLSEITKAKDGGADGNADLPMLKETLGDNAIERLNRSANFAEAVEAVVIEYEKTIQSLESSLTQTRSTLAEKEETLTDKQSRIAYMETIQQQLQARVQKAMDRESSAETYLRELESKLDGSATGEEKSSAIITELRKELTRLREGGDSAEEYITTLEERLAEAEQDQEIMQVQIDRLEHVVERQRSMGRLDNLLSELDNTRRPPTSAKASHSAKKALPKTNGHRESYDPFRPSSPSALSETAQTEDEFTDAQADQDDKTEVGESPSLTALPVVQNGDRAAEARSPAQNDFMADKLENLTQELFDLRSEHESVITDFDNLQQKYQTALETLAKLEYDKEIPKTAATQTFLSTTAGADGYGQSGTQSASSRGLGVDLSSPTAQKAGVEASDDVLVNGADTGSDDTDHVVDEDEVRQLRRAHAEQSRNYQILSDRHQSALEQVEDMKLELQRASMRPASPNIGAGAFGSLHRRKSGDILAASLGGTDRASKSLTHLKNIAVDRLDQDPDARQVFESNLHTVMSELNSQKEKSASLEAELGSVKKEMETKAAIISGLTRERSSLQSGAGVDFTVVGQLRDQLEESENQIRALHDQHAAREAELHTQLASFKSKLTETSGQLPTPRDSMPGAFADPDDIELRRDADREHIAHLQSELVAWEDRHNAAMEAMKLSEAKLLHTIADLEGSLASPMSPRSPSSTNGDATRGIEVGGLAAATSASLASERENHRTIVDTLQKEVEQYRNLANEHVGKMSELEQSYNSILAQVDQDSKSKDLSSKELSMHKDLITNLETQLQAHKSTVAVHQESLDDLQTSHAKELEALRGSMEAAEHESKERYAMLEEQHKSVTAHLQEELSKSQTEHNTLLTALNQSFDHPADSSQIPEQVQALVSQSKDLHTRHAKATGDLKSVQEELQTALTNTVDLENKIGELKSLHDEQTVAFTKLQDKERKSSRLVEELEEQLNSNFDSHRAATHRLSKMETETDRVRQDMERELEEQKLRVIVLEQQLAQAKRSSLVSDRNSVNFNRESLSPEAAAFALARSASTSSNLRKSGSAQALPSAPPSIPLPPLPPSGVGSPTLNGGELSPAFNNSPQDMSQADAAAAQVIEEQEARIRTIEKHLFAEKQLTATLEEALVDLETSANRTKSEMESYRKRCSSLEDELVSMKKDKTNSRASLQAVEEEREMRVRAERARQALEQRMMELNSAKKKKKNALNCF